MKKGYKHYEIRQINNKTSRVEAKIVKLTSADDHNFIIHRTLNTEHATERWSVTETVSGARAGWGKTQKEAIEYANERIFNNTKHKTLDQYIEESITTGEQPLNKEEYNNEN